MSYLPSIKSRTAMHLLGLAPWHDWRDYSTFFLRFVDGKAAAPRHNHSCCMKASELWEGAPKSTYNTLLPISHGNSAIMASKMANINVLAKEALRPASTDALFVQYHGFYTEVCARWIRSGAQTEEKVAAFGRILPLAPHLTEHAERFLAHVSQSPYFGPQNQQSQNGSAVSCGVETLLGAFRLLSYDCRTFAQFVHPVAVQ